MKLERKMMMTSNMTHRDEVNPDKCYKTNAFMDAPHDAWRRIFGEPESSLGWEAGRKSLNVTENLQVYGVTLERGCSVLNQFETYYVREVRSEKGGTQKLLSLKIVLEH